MKKIVITGGSYSGKTKIINELKHDGYQIVPEASIKIIEELNEKLGVEGQKKWRQENIAEFQMMIANKKKSMESLTFGEEREIVFCDRGVFDCIAYLQLVNQKVPQPILDLAKTHRYDLVFILDTISDFKLRNESGHISTKEDSQKVNKLLHKVYTEYKHKVIRVEEMDEIKEISIQKRIKFIKHTVRGEILS